VGEEWGFPSLQQTNTHACDHHLQDDKNIFEAWKEKMKKMKKSSQVEECGDQARLDLQVEQVENEGKPNNQSRIFLKDGNFEDGIIIN
jgi:hypothetical protein